MKLLLLLFLLIAVPVSAMQWVTGNFLIDVNREYYESEYGEDLMRVMEEAEVIWIRENKYTLYDYMGKQNYPVSHLSDEKINFILTNEKSRELAGIDVVNITPYMDKARGINFEEDIKEKEPEIEEPTVVKKEEVTESKSIKKTWGKVEEKEPEVEKPKVVVKKCVQKSPITFNPWKVNYWGSDLILKKLGIKSVLTPDYC